MIPIYQAKRKEFDELVQGYYFKAKNGYTGTFHCISLSPILIDGKFDKGNIVEIDPNTLKISFNGGESFDSISKVNRAINYVKRLAKV